MKKIDPDTVRRILDTADIVDVVSDFVKLRRSGANYKGLCPFHSERTPSFSVNKARNICKCFSCGKGGSPVGFLMELEKMSYQEALRYLAKKYNIEIVERDMSDEERQAEDDRQSMLTVNDYALEHFEHNLTDTDEGRNIGLAYFRQRGINDAMICRFHLGYSIEKGNALTTAALAKGYNLKYLIQTGVTLESERGPYDRFRGRVMFPVHSIAGRVVAFGGRTLRTDKTGAKYVNSPESLIYSKSNELYGLYQAKTAISKKDKCILVEGYMDVISMHQSGVENVVASSGTSLTEGQIRLISRFTKNVTVIYDSDAAGIKASLRGIDMLLRAGLKIKVLSLPDGDDPDSYAQTHTAQELEDYLAANEVDFIRFKTRILLKDAGDDPTRRAAVINDILRSIAVIPDEVERTVYVDECSRLLGISETVLTRQLAAIRGRSLVEEANERQKAEARRSIDSIVGPANQSEATSIPATPAEDKRQEKSRFAPYERELLKYVLRYAFYDFCDMVGDDDSIVPTTVYEYVDAELRRDNISFTDPECMRCFAAVGDLTRQWAADSAHHKDEALARREAMYAQGLENIRANASSVASVNKSEADLIQACDTAYRNDIDDYASDYAARHLLSSPDDTVRRLATDLTTERHQLSKIHSKYAAIATEREQLSTLLPRAIYELKDAVVRSLIAEITAQLGTVEPSDTAAATQLMQQFAHYHNVLTDLAKILGDRIITPPAKNS